ncbi:MAG: MarR family transcriptional regulator [Archaeoglobaceae archaeon]
MLTEYEMRVLLLLKTEGELRYTEIQEKTKLQQGTLTRILNRLVEEGYIHREMRGTKMPPAVFYRITESGLKALDEERRKFINTFPMYFIDFTEEEKKEIAELVEKLKKKLGV